MTEPIRCNHQLQSLRQELGQLSADIAGHRRELHILLGCISIWEHNICEPITGSFHTATADNAYSDLLYGNNTRQKL